MKISPILLFVIAFPTIAQPESALGTLELTTLRYSEQYDEGSAGREVLRRIQAGVYEDYSADLCVDDESRCNGAVFDPYKNHDDGRVTWSISVTTADWDDYPGAVRFEIIQEILYYTWGHRARNHGGVDARFRSAPSRSPLDKLNPTSREMYLKFGRPEYLKGGKGRYAYGPNCWYNTISAVADDRATYTKSRSLRGGSWDTPRFMGPTEFRCHMKHFREVPEPEFGDVVRYYTDEPIYRGGLFFGGEVHGATYVGDGAQLETPSQSGPVVLTKNGRSDLDFLIFQDTRGLDAIYLKPREGLPTANKSYLRVKKGARLLDPAKAGEESDCHAAYLIDVENYSDRWACLAGELDPPPGDGTTCLSYPGEWRIEGDEPSSDLRSAGDVNSPTPTEPVPHLEPKRVPVTWTTLRDSSG